MLSAEVLVFCFADKTVSLLVSFFAVLPLYMLVMALLSFRLCSELKKERYETIEKPLSAIKEALVKCKNGNITESIGIPHDSAPEISELCDAVNGMLSSVRALDKMRSNFMSSVSHDMRTPMTTISGFIDCILDGAIAPEKQEQYLRLIKSEVMRLSRLVSSLLDIARIQAGDREFIKEPFDVCETARVILFSFEKLIDEKKLNVEFDTDADNLFVTADEDAIHQVIYNIADNAVKFSKTGGTLEFSLKRDGNGGIEISVRNEGEGIPYEDQPFVFERFFKSDKTRGLDKNGSGLGMYISKAITDAHGSELKLESVPESFCRFYFTLPEADKPINRRLKRYD